MANANAPKAATKSEIFAGLSESTSLSKKDIQSVFDALGELIKKNLGKKGPGVFTVPGLLKLKVIHKPKVTGGKQVPNPFKPGEMMITKDKPARNVVKALPLKGLKDMV